jgi:TolB-like protein
MAAHRIAVLSGPHCQPLTSSSGSSCCTSILKHIPRRHRSLPSQFTQNRAAPARCNRVSSPHSFLRQEVWTSRLLASAPSSVKGMSAVAVLPFADMSPARDQEYFSDGLAEQLINDLAKVSGLKVIGRSSAFQFKGKNEDLRDVGRKLGVANVLEGSVSREGNHVRITAELIKADDGFQLWSQTYDREIEDIFAVQDEIALAATQALQLKLLGADGQPVAPILRSTNPEAYQAYLQANYFLGGGRVTRSSARRSDMPTRRSSSMRDMHQLGLSEHRCRTRWRRSV